MYVHKYVYTLFKHTNMYAWIYTYLGDGLYANFCALQWDVQPLSHSSLFKVDLDTPVTLVPLLT
jgi:hypothetical protein